MINWDLYTKRVNMNGITERDRLINQTKQNISNKAPNSPAYKSVLVNNQNEKHLIIISTKANNKKKFTTLPNDIINIGDNVDWNGLHWFVTSVDFDDEIVRRGELQQCNRIIKWQNPNTKEIIERWCFCSQPYSSGVDDGKVINILNGKYKIQLPYDNETKLISVDKRFMFDIVNNIPEIYKVVFADRNTNKYQDIDGGFIELVLVSDTDLPNDNLELMICDYISPDSPALPPTPSTLKCEIKGRMDIKIGGSTRTYEAVFYNSDDVIDNTITPIWELQYNPLYSDYITFEQNGNLINISCLDCEDLISEKIVLKLKDKDGLYQNQLEIECVVI